jgi:hypothetical protein
MANAPADPNEAHAEAVADAKRLMRLARTGALARPTKDPGGAPAVMRAVKAALDWNEVKNLGKLLSLVERPAGTMDGPPIVNGW